MSPAPTSPTPAPGSNTPSQRPPLRILVIPAGFDPRLNYQENVFARSLHSMGHHVTVLTSSHGPPSDLQSWQPLDNTLPFPVIRSSRVLRIRRTQFPFDWSIPGFIRSFNPEIAILLAPNHGLGVAWMRHLPPSCRVISIFSDIPWHRAGSPWREAFKTRWARRVFRRSSVVASATDETTALLRRWGGHQVDSVLEPVGLCVDPASLASNGNLPPAVSQLRNNASKLGVIVTRISPEKELDLLFASIKSFLEADPTHAFIIAGFGDDQESARIRAIIENSPVANRCLLLPLLASDQIGDLFRCADFSLWSLASIGLYHSLACGCPVVIRKGGGSAQHLVAEGQNGLWYQSLDSAATVMLAAVSHPWNRDHIRQSIAPFHPQTVLNRLIDIALRRPSPAA